MERPILDFFIAIGNNMDDELGEYKVFNIVSDPKIKNGRVILNLRAVDVNVRRNGSFYLFNLILNRPNIVGRLDLDKRRDCAVDEQNFFSAKDGKPSVWFAFPDTFEQLPMMLKQNKFFGTSLRLAYLQKLSVELQEQTLREQGYQQAEINDILSQSQTKLNEFILKTVNDYTQVNEQNLKKGSPKDEQKPDEQGGKFY